jgi:hypothetical protein
VDVLATTYAARHPGIRLEAGELGEVWTLRIAGIITASLTAYFVALAVLTGPAHGDFIVTVAVGATISLLLLVSASRLRKRKGL